MASNVIGFYSGALPRCKWAGPHRADQRKSPADTRIGCSYPRRLTPPMGAQPGWLDERQAIGSAPSHKQNRKEAEPKKWQVKASARTCGRTVTGGRTS